MSNNISFKDFKNCALFTKTRLINNEIATIILMTEIENKRILGRCLILPVVLLLGP